MEDLKMKDPHVSHTLGCSGVRETGTPKDRDMLRRN
jgi:hypothetical protein